MTLHAPSSLAFRPGRVANSFALRTEVLTAFQEQWQEGAGLDARAFLARYPDLLGDKTLLLELAYEEYSLRQEAGEEVNPEEFCRRFGSIQVPLHRLIEVDGYFDAHSHLVASELPIPWPRPGDTFFGFQLRRELGRGAFARVFLATQPALGNRLVAVKISSRGATEAETLGRLGHPNIVPIHSVDKDEASHLTVVCMPYLGSITLSAALDRIFARPQLPTRAQELLDAARAGVTPDEPAAERDDPDPIFQQGSYIDGVLHLGVQMADALAFIHKAGVCHRDLKPSNVLLTPAGRPVLLDFNLSYDALAAEHRLGGTLPYMSPEQLLSMEAPSWEGGLLLDERADLYSLGVMLYELLTGAHPFGRVPSDRPSEELRQWLLARQRQGLRPLRELNPYVDNRLARLVEQCLAYDRDQRIATAAELATALRAGLSWQRRARRWLSAHPGAALAASLTVALLAVAGTSYAAFREPYVDRELRAGRQAAQAGDPAAAVAHLSRVLETDPQNAAARTTRAQALVRLGWAAYGQQAYEEALASFNQALQDDPAVPGGLYGRGRANLGRGQWTLAMADFAEAARREPTGPVQACLGYGMSQEGRHAQAVIKYEWALQEGLATAELFNNLGYSHIQLGKPDHLERAKSYLDQALALAPTLQPARHNRALVALKRLEQKLDGVPESALVDIEEAIRLGPPSAELYYHAARLYEGAARATSEDPRLLTRCLACLRMAVSQGWDPDQLRADPSFRRLRSDPRFAEVLGQPADRRTFLKVPRFVDPVASLGQPAGT